jgi:uncharacterized protein YndB with AHSA1/START domain
VAASTKGPFRITRTFNAPRDVVWKAWTDVNALKQWFGPKGFTTSFAKLDLRPGGIYHYCLQGPNDSEMWGRWMIREVTPPERLVVISSFSDKDGGVTVHSMAPTWPRQTLSTTTFTEAGGKTTVHLRWEAYEATDLEQRTFDEGHDSMTQGWTGTMEQLEAYLAKR